MSTIMFSSLDKLSKKRLIHELKEFYIPYRYSLELPKIATFGTEIEFSIHGYNKKYIKKLFKDGYHDSAREFLLSIYCPMIWKCKEETFEQIEIISDVLIDETQTWQTLEYILKFLLDNQAYSSELSGAHIHIGKQLLECNSKYWCYFLKLWCIFEKEIIKFSNGENYFKRPCFKNSADYSTESIKKIIYNIENEKYNEKIGLLGEKKNSIYFLPTEDKLSDLFTLKTEAGTYNKSDTIEIRCPNGTLNKVIWQNNINFFTKMILACTSTILDRELMDYLYKNTVLKKKNKPNNMELFLADLVFDNNFDKYCFLRQYYKDFDEPKKYEVYAKSKPFWK